MKIGISEWKEARKSTLGVEWQYQVYSLTQIEGVKVLISRYIW